MEKCRRSRDVEKVDAFGLSSELSLRTDFWRTHSMTCALLPVRSRLPRIKERQRGVGHSIGANRTAEADVGPIQGADGDFIAQFHGSINR
jgi:hypothetical protein